MLDDPWEDLASFWRGFWLACSRHFDRKTLSEIESEAAAGLLLETLRRGEPKPPPKAGEIFPGITLHDGSTDEHPGVSVDCEIPEGEPLPLFAKELRRTIHTAIAATDTHARDLALELSPHVARCLVWTDETYAQSQELLGIPCTVVAPPGPMAQLIISEGERPTVACVLIPEHPPETEEENA